jgi:two-component system, OmpR family, phosphate regulon sensor histidine kinase PhoR
VGAIGATRFITLLTLPAGLAVLGWAAAPYIREIEHLKTLEALGIGLVLISTCSGLAALMLSRRAARRLGAALSAAKWQDESTSLPCENPDLAPVVNAVERMVGATHQAVAAAQLKIKETEIRLKVATLERQHAEAVIYSISDAVLVTDTFDELVLANESAAKAFSFSLRAAQRSPVERILRDDRMIDLIREMRQSDSTNGRRIVEHRLPSPEGDRVYNVTLSCVADSAARPAGVVAVLHDVTREKEVSEMKNDFVSHVSHELRTPLASIKAYVEMLIDGEAGDEKTRTDFYEVIQNEANRLGRLIDNILNISRIESGLVKVKKQPLSLTVILADALEVIAPQARAKQICLDKQLPPVCYQTLVDRDMMYQAALNLLSNAVKYTPEGGVIRVETDIDEVSRKVTTRIIDSGVGIPPKDLPHVFDKFYRVEANNGMAKGTGLGLSLVKQIVETVHGGRILVESEQGKGSSFGFELDLC